MKEEVIIAGFGGQGVLSMGKILAHSAVAEGYEVSWMPSYGPEMRGGTANVTVVMSDNPISSPIVTECDVAVVLNSQALDKFEQMVRPGGVLIYDLGGVARRPVRKDIEVWSTDAAVRAAEMGNSKLFNMLILGAYLHLRPVVSIESVREGLLHTLSERALDMLDRNVEAVVHGGEIVNRLS